MHRAIVLTFDFLGLHYWSGAPEACFWLRNEHLHRFRVEATVQVHDWNRDLEFITESENLKRDYLQGIERHQTSQIYRLHERSCELVAEEIFDLIRAGGNKPLSVTVSEDGNWQGAVFTDTEDEPHNYE